MGDDGTDEDDPWFERVTGPETDESSHSKPSTDDTEEAPIQTSDEWEWVQPDESDSQDQDEEGERIWEHFEGTRPDAAADSEGAPDHGAASDDAPTTVDTGRSDSPESETDSVSSDARPPSPPARSEQTSDADVPSPPARSEQTSDAEVPPPPPPDEQEGVAATPPGPTREDIQELQPLYRQRTTEFYLLWLVATLSYGLGDILTTSVVLVSARVSESNPFVAFLLEQFGFGGFLGAKLVIFGLLIVISVRGGIENERLSYYAPPVLAVVIGVGLTLSNLGAILGL